MKKSFIVLAALTAAIVGNAAEPLPLTDKTLVAWVSLANLNQQGGSALTIQSGDEFDAIVFGERARGKWMAGNDRYRRTQRDQSANAIESAGPEAVVQVAMVYEGANVRIYRNGESYATHTVPPVQLLRAPNPIAVFGLRHVGAGNGSFLAGSIEDARIYGRALTVTEIQSLRPNVASEIKPLAWWDFEGDTVKDRAGHFMHHTLVGGAKLKDGRLVLDGTGYLIAARTEADAKLVARSEVPPAPAGPFVPETPAWPDQPPPNWMTFHLAHPGYSKPSPFDPNCAIFWKGRYHLFYIYKQDSGFVFGHVSSTDMVHWKWHPTTLTPQMTHHGMFSGTGFFTKEGKPAIIYHGQGSGRNQIAVAEDDQLDKWSKPWKVEPIIRPDQDGSKIANWDPDAWLEGDTYYALSGGTPGSGKPLTLFKSSDLKTWNYLGLFLAHDMPDVQPTEDVSCPNFFKIGNKYMLLCISHTLGCRYYLGTWKDEKFTPDFHARMTWNGRNRDFFAPESVLTEDGRRVMWAWMMGPIAPMGVQSLPRELSLPEDGVLRIKSLRELESLRFDEKRDANLTVKSDAASILKGGTGDAMELRLAIAPGKTQEFGLDVLCNTDGEKGLQIAYEAETKTLRVGQTRAPFALREGEDLVLRVFIDKNLVEVFANDRQAAVGEQNYVEGNTGIRLFSKGGDVAVKEVKSWKLKSIYEPSVK
ncbi:MAG: GH32 C-terminal domain-containing protein [Verrucomicrobiota bacterium]